MSSKLSSTQVNVLLNLMITGDEPQVSKVKPSLTSDQRKQLTDAGLVKVEKRSRLQKKRTISAQHLVLTEKAWAWISDNLAALDSYRLSVSSSSIKIFLTKLKMFMDKNSTTLVEILSPPPLNIEEKIRSAYLQASGGKWSARVRLADLRRHLPDIPRKSIDDCLTTLLFDQKLILYRMDDPLEITPEDNQAAIDIAGQRKHIIYIEG